MVESAHVSTQAYLPFINYLNYLASAIQHFAVSGKTSLLDLICPRLFFSFLVL